MTETTFNPTAALMEAEVLVAQRADEVASRLAADRLEAIDRADRYARHLAGGGDPAEYEDDRWGAGASRLVSSLDAMAVVFDAWNEARGGRHAVRPFRNVTAYRIAERLTERIGEPVLYADLAVLGPHRKQSAGVVAEQALKVEASGELVLRKAKVDGKAAYFVRERRPDDPERTSRVTIPTETPVPA